MLIPFDLATHISAGVYYIINEILTTIARFISPGSVQLLYYIILYYNILILIVRKWHFTFGSCL